MKHRYRSKPASTNIVARWRIGFTFAGVLMLLSGGLTLLAGRSYYGGWRGEAVFAPFAVAIGLIALVAAIQGPPARMKTGKRMR